MNLFDLDGKNKKITELSKEVEGESFWSNQNHSKKVITELNALKKIVNEYYDLKKQLELKPQEKLHGL